MTMKPFEIQSTALSIGGVKIETSLNSKLVIPGITRATVSVAIEVQDTQDQTRSWNVDAQTLQIIDGYTYEVNYNGYSQSIVGWTAAQYAADNIDGEGFIDGISVVDGGAGYTGEAVTFSTVMYASEDGSTWYQIPFRVRCGAGDIESEFGSGGGANNLSDLHDTDISNPQDGDVLAWDANNEVWHNVTPSGGGGGGGSIDGLSGSTSSPEQPGDLSYELAINTNNTNDTVALRVYAGDGAPGPSIQIGQADNISRGLGAIAIGNDDVGYEQGDRSIAIGYQAGWAGDGPIGHESIAIGAKAAYNYASQNSIILNASGNELNSDNAGLYINPVREDVSNTAKAVYYNTATSELTYADPTGGGGGGAAGYANFIVADGGDTNPWNLSDGDVNSAVQVWNADIILPQNSNIGDRLVFTNQGDGNPSQTISTYDSERVIFHGTFQNSNSITLNYGETLELTSRGTGEWDITGGSVVNRLLGVQLGNLNVDGSNVTSSENYVNLTTGSTSGFYANLVTGIGMGSSYAELYSENDNDLSNQTYAWINTKTDISGSQAFVEVQSSTDGNTHRWTFNQDGNMVFPDNTVQTTAYPGPSSSASVFTSDTAPDSPVEGDLWFDTVSGQMYIYFENTWVDSSPSSSGGSSSGNSITSGTWTFSVNNSGQLFLNNDGTDHSLWMPRGDEMLLDGLGGNVVLCANDNIEWNFSTDGNLHFPDGSVQSTAYTGGGSTYGDSNVGTYLSSYTGELGASNIAASGNVNGQYLHSTNSSGDEGGEILLASPQTNSSIAGTGITIDVYKNKLRIFEQGGDARGGYFDITSLGAGVSTNLAAGGGGTTLPADAAGYLRNNGSGTLTWNTNTVSTGQPSYSDVWVLNAKADNFWTTYTMTGNVGVLFQGGGMASALTFNSTTAYGKQLNPGDKIFTVNNGQVHGQPDYLVIELPSSPNPGDSVLAPAFPITATLSAGTDVTVGVSYTIASAGTTNWTAVGAPYNGQGATFTATQTFAQAGTPRGTGTATYVTGVNNIIWKPATGQRYFTSAMMNGGGMPSAGEGCDYIAGYIPSSWGQQPVSFVYAGLVDSIPTWYQGWF